MVLGGADMIRSRVLAVDDEPGMQSFYREFFDNAHRSEFVAQIAPSAEEALRLSKAEPPDVAVLDWTMPGMSGLELARALRADARTRATRILMVTVHGTADEVCEALDGGAYEHLGKPFDEKVLLAKLRSLARRRFLSSEQPRIIRFEDLELDAASNRLLIGRRPVHLTPKELDILKLLLERPNRVHAASSIWDSVWNEDMDSWRENLMVTISCLRRKLGPKWGARIECQRSRGYLLRARRR